MKFFGAEVKKDFISRIASKDLVVPVFLYLLD